MTTGSLRAVNMNSQIRHGTRLCQHSNSSIFDADESNMEQTRMDDAGYHSVIRNMTQNILGILDMSPAPIINPLMKQALTATFHHRTDLL